MLNTRTMEMYLGVKKTSLILYVVLGKGWGEKKPWKRALVQIGLDMLSMKGTEGLVTKKVDEEYMYWWTDEGETIFSLVDTSTLSMKSEVAGIVVRDKNGKVVPSPPPMEQHHLGFRFFRYSQVSEDLFGAYRNMYLAFEHLLSSKHPKGKELEVQWLSRALNLVSDELNLDSIANASEKNSVEFIIDEVYRNARLPLFHAKNGKLFFTPANELADEEATLNSLALLSQIVTKMASKWFRTRRMGSWFNEKIFEEQYPKMFENAIGGFSASSVNCVEWSEIGLDHDVFTSGKEFPLSYDCNLHGKKQPNLKGRIKLNPALNTKIKTVTIRNDESLLIGGAVDSLLELDGIEWFEHTCLLKTYQGGQPRSLFHR